MFFTCREKSGGVGISKPTRYTTENATYSRKI